MVEGRILLELTAVYRAKPVVDHSHHGVQSERLGRGADGEGFGYNSPFFSIGPTATTGVNRGRRNERR